MLFILFYNDLKFYNIYATKYKKINLFMRLAANCSKNSRKDRSIALIGSPQE